MRHLWGGRRTIDPTLSVYMCICRTIGEHKTYEYPSQTPYSHEEHMYIAGEMEPFQYKYPFVKL